MNDVIGGRGFSYLVWVHCIQSFSEGSQQRAATRGIPKILAVYLWCKRWRIPLGTDNIEWPLKVFFVVDCPFYSVNIVVLCTVQ